MSDNLKDILSNLNPDVDQETLLKYLQGKLTPEQQHEVERSMLEDDFDTEAMEGLGQFSDNKKVELLLAQLKMDLKQKTEKKKRFRKKLELKLEPWIIITAVIILLLAVLSYFVIHRYLNP